jgi:hypothetical protein
MKHQPPDPIDVGKAAEKRPMRKGKKHEKRHGRRRGRR